LIVVPVHTPLNDAVEKLRSAKEGSGKGGKQVDGGKAGAEGGVGGGQSNGGEGEKIGLGSPGREFALFIKKKKKKVHGRC